MKQKTTMKFMGVAAALCLTLAAGSLLFSGNEANAYADEPPMTVTDGASVKYKESATDSGMRFNFRLTETAYNEAYDEDGNFKTGMATGALLIPSSMLDGDLNHTAKESNDKIVEVKFGETDGSEWTQSADGYYTNYVYVYDFPEAAYNTDVSVVGFYKSGDEYAYTSVVTRSMAYVANEALKATDLQPEQKAILDSYLINYNVTVKTSDEDAGTTYSVKYGKKLSEATGYTDPEKDESWWFGGFKSANDGNTYAASGYTVKGEDVLTAQWQKYKPDSFNTLVEGTLNEYMIADFTSTAYSHLLSTKGTPTYSQTTDGLAYSNVNWDSTYVKYTLPEQIALSDLAQIKFSCSGSWGYIKFYDENGGLIGAKTTVNHKNITAEEFFTSESSPAEGNRGTKLAWIALTGGNEKNYSIKSITYTKKATKPESFNTPISEGSNEYLLADFTTTDYLPYLSVVQRAWSGYDFYVKDLGHTSAGITYSNTSGLNEYVKYTLPAAISLSNVTDIKMPILDEWDSWYWFDESGTNHYVQGSGFAKSLTTALASNPDIKLAAIGLSGKTNKHTVAKITCTKTPETPASFNALIDGTENEYMLADFTNSSYIPLLEKGSAATMTLVEGALEVKLTAWNDDNTVTYVLPESIAREDIVTVNVYTLAGNDIGLRILGKDAKNADKYGWFGTIGSNKTNSFAMPTEITDNGNYVCTVGDLTALRLCGSGTAKIVKITYTKNVTTAE